jgi:cellulose synthase/poly-beta-1,6-N-acetylglucosamine synthase-like glycosyltransferase
MTIWIFGIITITLLLPYWVGVFYLFFCWKKTEDFVSPSTNSSTSVSVLVPFRNEEKHLPELIESLKKQDYNPTLTEFILINDHSSDNSLTLAQTLTLNDNRFIIISLPDNYKGKKSAIEFALLQAKGYIIIQTDADCCMNSKWISEFVNVQQLNNYDLIIAPVAIESNACFFAKLQSIEFASLSAVVGGAALAQKPLLINAANMAYKKHIINNLTNPFKREKASGDDQFLLQNMLDHKMKIGYLKSTQAIVTTQALSSISEFIYQRVRWASKSKAYKSALLKSTAILIFLLNVWIVVLFFVSFIHIQFILLYISAICIKSTADYPLLKNFQQWSKQAFNVPLFATTQLLYSFYTTFTSLWSMTRSVKWKQRKVY